MWFGEHQISPYLQSAVTSASHRTSHPTSAKHTLSQTHLFSGKTGTLWLPLNLFALYIEPMAVVVRWGFKPPSLSLNLRQQQPVPGVILPWPDFKVNPLTPSSRLFPWPRVQGEPSDAWRAWVSKMFERLDVCGRNVEHRGTSVKFRHVRNVCFRV